VFALPCNGLSGHTGWVRPWRSRQPKSAYGETVPLYGRALKLWEGLPQVLNYNVMYSARGVMMLAHNTHDVQVLERHVYANRLNSVDSEWLTPREAKAFSPTVVYRSCGALFHGRRGAIAPRRPDSSRSRGLRRSRMRW